MQQKEKQTLLHWAQFGIRLYIWAQALTLIVWSFFSIIPGVGNALKETESGFNSVSQLGFWLAYEIFLLTVGGTVISLNSSPRTMRNAVTLYIVTLVIGIGANIVHIVASSLELSRCTSVVCIHTPSVLATLIMFYAFLLAIECFAVFMAVKYRNFVVLQVKKK